MKIPVYPESRVLNMSDKPLLDSIAELTKYGICTGFTSLEPQYFSAAHHLATTTKG